MKYATFAALAIFYTLFIGVGIWIKANELHPAIKFAQPSFLYAVLFGCTIGVTSVIFFGIDRHISDEEAYKEQTEGSSEICHLYTANTQLILTSIFHSYIVI
jgi:hypothetical protein